MAYEMRIKRYGPTRPIRIKNEMRLALTFYAQSTIYPRQLETKNIFLSVMKVMTPILKF